jgi:hypothetical protein
MMIVNEIEKRSTNAQRRHMIITFTDFLELVCRFADVLGRGKMQGSLPWDIKSEGSKEIKLAGLLQDFLESQLKLKPR